MRAFLAPYWKAFWPTALPRDVDTMTPSHVAAVLGLDVDDGLRPRSPEDVPAPRPKHGNRAQRRRRKQHRG